MREHPGAASAFPATLTTCAGPPDAVSRPTLAPSRQPGALLVKKHGKFPPWRGLAGC